MPSKLRIVFMGTPEFAAHILKKLSSDDSCDVVAAYCQPDRPSGRGKKFVFPPVKVAATELNIPIYQPINFKNAEDVLTLKSFNPDLLIVAAYGLILPQCVLDIPKLAPLNVHASLLPDYRGAAPIQRAIIDNIPYTGVSIMHMQAGLDTGPVYLMAKQDILSYTTASLHDELSELGADILTKLLPTFASCRPLSTEQDEALATYAPKLCKHDGVIFWNTSADFVDAQIRGVTPWPGAQVSVLRGEKNKLDLLLAPGMIGHEKQHYASILGCDANTMQPGQIWRLDKNLIGICAQDKFYILSQVKPQNKSYIDAGDFSRGYFGKGLGLISSVVF